MPVQQMNISKLSKHANGLKWFPLAVAGTSHIWPTRKPSQNPSQRQTPPGVGGQVQPNANEFQG